MVFLFFVNDFLLSNNSLYLSSLEIFSNFYGEIFLRFLPKSYTDFTVCITIVQLFFEMDYEYISLLVALYSEYVANK